MRGGWNMSCAAAEGRSRSAVADTTQSSTSDCGVDTDADGMDALEHAPLAADAWGHVGACSGVGALWLECSAAGFAPS